MESRIDELGPGSVHRFADPKRGDIPLEEPYIVEKMDQQEIFHFEIPENSYFMLGDNRNNSTDARYWRNTYIAREKIIAKVFMEYYPQIKIVQ